jgi:phage-related protein
MAEQADGSIIIDTEIDAQGFRAGSAELQRAIKSLNTKMDSLGPTFQKVISGNTSAVETFDAKATTLEKTISDIEAKMESLGNKRVPTEDYQWLTTEIEKAKNELAKLEDKQIKMEDTGVKKNSRSWKSLQYDIDLAKRKIEEYEGEQAEMRANGTAFQMGTDTAEYSQLESSLASAKSRLAQMRSEADNAGNSSNRLLSIAKGIGRAFSTVGKVGITAFKGLKAGIQTGISKLKSLSKTASGGCTQAIGKLGKKITGLGSMIKRMLIRKLILAMFTSIKEGVNNLAQYSSQTNASLSTLKSGLTQLKNSLATAFAPILTAVTPMLATLINYLSSALTYVGKFTAALTGAKTFTKATAVQEDYAESLNSTSTAAEKAQKQLAGFDELNVLSDSSSSESDTSGVSPSEMFEEVAIESNITDFVDRLKAAFKAGDYAEIGSIIGYGINTALQKVNDFISWDNVGSTVTKIVSSIAEGFNSLIYTVDWELLGDTVAQELNTVLNTLYLTITEFDWPAVTAAFARSLNSLVSGFDWGKLGTTISTGFITALESIRSAITTFNWAGLGSGIAEGVNKIDWVGAFSQAAGALSDAVKGLLDLCIGFVEKLDWGKLGTDLWNSLVGIVQNIDWGGIVSKAFGLLGGAIGGCAKLLVELGKSFWESLKQGFEDTKEYFNTYIEEAGGNIIEGIWNGIIDALKNVGNWIVENIWNPFIEGFKNAFGISSPSTKMAEMGGYVIEGLWNGISDAWNSITEFFSNALSDLGELISGAWDSVKSTTSTAWTNVKTTVSNAWSNIKTNTTSSYNTLKSNISGAWNNIKSTASTAWSNIKSTIQNKGWSGVGSNICSGIKSGIDSGWSWLKNTVGDLATSLLDKAKSALGIHSPSRLFRDIVGLNIGYGIGEGIEASEDSVVDTVTGLADAIAAEANAGKYDIGGIISTAEVDGALTGFSDKIADSFTNLLDRLQAIAEGVTFSVPAMAGNVIPYSVAASANNGPQNGVTEAITASNDELSSVIIQSVTNATTAIVGAIQDYSGTTVNLDTNSLTTGIIKEINRRTRMNGKSPLTTA